MVFWVGVLVGFLANVFAGVLLVIVYVVIQWFLAATDVINACNRVRVEDVAGARQPFERG